MGLAQFLERPRNWGDIVWTMATSVSVTQNGQFANLAMTSFGSTENSSSLIFPYPIVVHRLYCMLQGNSLDALSTNTLTLRLDTVNSTLNIVLTDADTNHVMKQTSGANIVIPAGERFTIIWNSDSVGAVAIRNLGLSYTAIAASVG